MARKRYKPEEIVSLLRQAEVLTPESFPPKQSPDQVIAVSKSAPGAHVWHG